MGSFTLFVAYRLQIIWISAYDACKYPDFAVAKAS